MAQSHKDILDPWTPAPRVPTARMVCLWEYCTWAQVVNFSALTRELYPDWLLQSEKLEQLKFVTGKPSLAGVENAPG